MRTISKRIPGWPQIAAVYSIIVLVLYIWTIMWFFWKLPSWFYFLSAWEITKIFSYSIFTNLCESLSVLLAPVLLAIVLPRKWFLDGFVSRSIVMVMIGMGYLMYLANLIQTRQDYPQDAVRLAPLVLAAMVVAVFLIGKIPFLGRIIDDIADRATVFLYISIPISLACLLVVLVQLVI